MPGKDIFNYSLDKIDQLDLNLICPQHGSIIKKQYIANLIDEMKQLDCGLYIENKYHDELLTTIKELQESKNEFKKQKQFLQEVINGAHEPIMVINKDYSVSLMNDMVKKLIDPDLIEDMSSPKCYEISHHQKRPCDGDNDPCPLKMVLEQNQMVKVTHNHPLPNGEPQYVELTAKPLYNDQGDIYAIIESAHDVTSHLKSHEELSQQKAMSDFRANHDHLTGLPLRALLVDRIQQSIEQAKRDNKYFAVLFIDLDKFKPINDTYGHQAGDKVLTKVAYRFNTLLRKVDTVARLGGDEFVIVINCLKREEDIIEIVEKLIKSVSEPVFFDSIELNVTLSVGVSFYPKDGKTTNVLLEKADSAMYQAKKQGANQYQLYQQSE